MLEAIEAFRQSGVELVRLSGNRICLLATMMRPGMSRIDRTGCWFPLDFSLCSSTSMKEFAKLLRSGTSPFASLFPLCIPLPFSSLTFVHSFPGPPVLPQDILTNHIASQYLSTHVTTSQTATLDLTVATLQGKRQAKQERCGEFSSTGTAGEHS